MMNQASKIILLYLVSISFISGCVSNKKFKAEQLKFAALNQEYNNLQIEIKQLTNLIEIRPTISNPPPQASAFLILEDTWFSKCKTFGDVDKILTTALSRGGCTNVFYFEFEGGFAIATAVDSVTESGELIQFSSGRNQSSIEAFRRFMIHRLDDLFLPPPSGFSRCFVFVVSPKIYQLNGSKKGYEEFSNSIRSMQNVIVMPESVRNLPLPERTRFVSLLYEFERSSNQQQLHLRLGGECQNHLNNCKPIQFIKNGN